MIPKSPRGNDHRNGAGHLEASYEADLRARICEKEPQSTDRAFISGNWTSDTSAEECAEEFVMTVTSGSDGGEHALDEDEIGTPDAGAELVDDADPPTS